MSLYNLYDMKSIYDFALYMINLISFQNTKYLYLIDIKEFVGKDL